MGPMFYASFRIAGGFLLLTLGLAGLVIPVLPGGALFVLGLGILARHFHWARQWLHRVNRLRHRLSESLRRLRGRPAEPTPSRT